mgnify:CR=1 FL=1
MLTEKIIKNVLFGEMIDAISQTEFILYEKMNERLGDTKTFIAMSLYNEGENKKPDKESGEYKKFYRLALKKFGIQNPKELETDEEKQKFYNYLDNNWESDAEVVTGKDDPSEDEEEAVASEKEANKKKMVRDNDEEDEEEVEENIMLAPKGKGRKAAKALYQDTTTEEEYEEDEWN